MWRHLHLRPGVVDIETIWRLVSGSSLVKTVNYTHLVQKGLRAEMRNALRTKGVLAGVALLLLGAAACSSSSADTGTQSGSKSCTTPKSPVITLAAYSTVYDVYGKLTA